MHDDRQDKLDLPKAVQQHVDQIVDDFSKDLVIPKHHGELGEALQEAADTAPPSFSRLDSARWC
jgi:hypothetical protein